MHIGPDFSSLHIAPNPTSCIASAPWTHIYIRCIASARRCLAAAARGRLRSSPFLKTRHVLATL